MGSLHLKRSVSVFCEQYVTKYFRGELDGLHAKIVATILTYLLRIAGVHEVHHLVESLQTRLIERSSEVCQYFELDSALTEIGLLLYEIVGRHLIKLTGLTLLGLFRQNKLFEFYCYLAPRHTMAVGFIN